MSGYLKFLQFALANIATVKLLLQKVQEIADILKSVNFSDLGGVIPTMASEGTLGLAEALTIEPSEEEAALEAEVLAMISPESPSEALAVRDGAKLRELFKLLTTYGPLIVQYAPTLIKLFGGK
jgi:hypothetical protein